MGIQEMVNFVESEEDLFFDSVDELSDEVWSNELRSVKERREAFLYEMGFVEARNSGESNDDASLERMVERTREVSSSCSSSSSDDYDEVFYGRDCDGGVSNLAVDECEHSEPIRPCMDVCRDDGEPSPSEECTVVRSVNKKIGNWWKEMMSKERGMVSRYKCESVKGEKKKSDTNRSEVRLHKKRFKELSALYTMQEIRAHKGVIWTMKFSPDGQYLASGGQYGVVRVWQVKSLDACPERFRDEFDSTPRGDVKTGFGREKKAKDPVFLPDKMLHIQEQPVHEFHGHVSDVLDLAWSDSNCLLSSSTDKTVRLWQVGSDECLNVFHHTDYVTCIQFNPIDNNQFISGSLDGKVRTWGLSKGRVIDWADVGDAVTAVCYQPDGQGFVVGSLGGTCRFYEVKGDLVELTAHILIHSNRRLSTNRITGIKFSPEDSRTVMVMSEDSKLRIFDKMDVVCKYRGLPKSGTQMSASYTSDGRHIISIGEDSHVYIWNNEHPSILSSKHEKSVRSCEHFYAEGVSVAVPWCGTETRPKVSCGSWSTKHEVASKSVPHFSFSKLFSSRSSATWPEELLPEFSSPLDQGQGAQQAILPSTWGLVIVTANIHGVIKTFHNYGLPVRV